MPDWVRAALSELPGLMAASDALAAQLQRACLAQVQAWLLAGRIGETFPAMVLRVAADGPGAEVFLPDLAVHAHCSPDGLSAGRRITVRLIEADPQTRTVAFAPV